MKKFIFILILFLLFGSLNARFIRDNNLTFSTYVSAKDSLNYIIVARAGDVLDTVAEFDTTGTVTFHYSFLELFLTGNLWILGDTLFFTDGGADTSSIMQDGTNLKFNSDNDFLFSREAEFNHNIRGVNNDWSILWSGWKLLLDYNNDDALAYISFHNEDSIKVDTTDHVMEWTGNGGIKAPSITIDDSLKAITSLWWYCKYMDAINLSPGGSGAVQTIPDDNTSGGYQLDAATEYLYFNGGVCNNWDEASDMEVKVRFELNAGSEAAPDSVFFDLKCWYKGVDEDTTKYQLVTKGQLVGNTPQYTMYTATIPIDYDLVHNVVQQGDIFSFRLNLNTTRSDVDNVIVNFGRFRYWSKVPQPTTY